MALITEIPIVTVSMFLYFFNQCQQLMDNRLLRNNVCSVLLKSIYDCKVFGLLTQHFFSISMIYISQKSHSGETPNFFLLECLARYDLWALIIKSCLCVGRVLVFPCCIINEKCTINTSLYTQKIRFVYSMSDIW